MKKWVLDVVSTVKTARHESILSNNMCHRGVTNVIQSLVSSSKSKEKGKSKAEDANVNGSKHHAMLRIVVLNKVNPTFDLISYLDKPLDDPYIGTKVVDAFMRKYLKREAQLVQ